MSGIANFAIRGAQIIFAAIVTGLSIGLARGHHWGNLPVILGYVSFVGCVSLLAGFAGLASAWIDALQGKIGLIIDGFIMLVNLAGGLVVAIKLDGVKCNLKDGSDNDADNVLKIYYNYLINGGIKKVGGGDLCYYCQIDYNVDDLNSRCKMNQADSAFMFLTVILLLVSLTLTYLRMKKGY